MFAKKQPWTNLKIWIPCGKPLKNMTFLLSGVIWVPQGVMMVPKVFSRESLILQLENDVPHVLLRLLEQKFIRKTKERQKKPVNDESPTQIIPDSKIFPESKNFPRFKRFPRFKKP